MKEHMEESQYYFWIIYEKYHKSIIDNSDNSFVNWQFERMMEKTAVDSNSYFVFNQN